VLTLFLEWDQGKGVWVPLIGGTSYSLLTSFIATGLVPGHWYQFRYTAKNEFGWGAPSNPTSIQAATQPDVLVPITTLIVGNNVRIIWLEPNSRGDSIHFYTILIQGKTGDFYADLADCYGSNLLIIV